MTAFQDQLAADVSGVFLDPAEFGVSIAIGWTDRDPAAVNCILDESEATNDADGVTQWDATLIVKTGDIPLPVVGQRLTIVDTVGDAPPRTRQANVAKVAEDMGAMTINLRWYDS